MPTRLVPSRSSSSAAEGARDPHRARAARTAPSRFMARVTPERRRLGWVANYFQISAGLGAVAFTVGIVAALVDAEGARAAVLGHPVMVMISAATVAGWWYTGHLLHERRREGGWMALLNLLPALSASLLGGGITSSLFLSAAGVLAVLTAWRDLH